MEWKYNGKFSKKIKEYTEIATELFGSKSKDT